MKESISRVLVGAVFFVLIMAAALPANAQSLPNSTRNQALPSNPQPTKLAPHGERFFATTALALPLAQMPGSQPNGSSAPHITVAPQAAGIPMQLTRKDAEQLAIRNNPRISIGRLLALAEHQVYRETRSTELPNFSGNITAVDAKEGSRIGAGALNAPRLLEHAGAGITLSQLLTDFGRTTNLVSASKLREKAQNANAQATTEDIVMATDQAFYSALENQALLKVAQQTVDTRQAVETQINELAKNNLKSNLDLTFAQSTHRRPSCCSWTHKTIWILVWRLLRRSSASKNRSALTSAMRTPSRLLHPAMSMG